MTKNRPVEELGSYAIINIVSSVVSNQTPNYLNII
jgi:hypothetical protein